MLTIAYHNLAVEQEFMHMYQEAVMSYKQAKDFACKYLGFGDSIAQNLTQTYEKAKAEIEVKIAKVKRQEEKLQNNRSKRSGSAAGQKGAAVMQSATYGGKPRRNLSIGGGRKKQNSKLFGVTNSAPGVGGLLSPGKQAAAMMAMSPQAMQGGGPQFFQDPHQMSAA